LLLRLQRLRQLMQRLPPVRSLCGRWARRIRWLKRLLVRLLRL